MNIILLDNYDSFTYNLVHYVQSLGHNVEVIRNDAITSKELLAKKPDAIIISPGPCYPSDAGITIELIKDAMENNIPLFGVCLGHQAIAEALGAKIIKADIPMHGKVSALSHNGSKIFNKVSNPFNATRYHSLVIDRNTLPEDLEITSETEDGVIMGISHKKLNVHGVQFHPESISSEFGHQMLENFLSDR